MRVHAAGINAADWKAREHGLPVGDVPFIPGWDIAGVDRKAAIVAHLQRMEAGLQ